MHAEDALIVVTLPVRMHRTQDRHLWETMDDALRTDQLGHVTGYSTGQGRHEVHLRVDRISWEEAWELLRSALAWHGLLGAATVHLQIPGEEPPQTLWPPP